MVIVLTTITFISSAAVGGVYKLTKTLILETNEEKFNTAIQQVLPRFDTIKEEVLVDLKDGSAPVKVYEATLEGKTAGYAVEASALGYTQDIILLVGFNVDSDIHKIAVLSHAETPGLGSKITDPKNKFVVWFEGKNPEDINIMVKNDGGEVDVITASTITSRAYSKGVQKAFDAIKMLKK